VPSKSKAQQHAMAEAMSGATFPLAKKLRANLTLSQLHDFAATSTKKLPAHVKAKKR